MPRFETVPAKRSHCSQIACLMRDDHREAIVVLGLDPFQEITAAFDETPHPMAWVVDDQLAALGGIAGPPGLCPVGIAWLVVAERAIRFPRALVREIKHQLELAHEVYPLLVSPLVPADKKSVRLAGFLNFAIELAYPQNGLLFAVCGKKQKSGVLQSQEATR